MIVPGSPGALLLAQNGDPLDELGAVARSLRFRSSAGGKLNKTFGAAGNQKTWTLHAWVKRGKIQGAGSAIPNSFVLGSGTGVQNYSYCGFGNNWAAGTDNLQMNFVTGNVQVATLQTNRQMRDMADFYALTFVVDTTNATSGDRLRLYVEDVRETSFSASLYPAQNTDLPYINTTTVQGIGDLVAAAGYTFDGEIAALCFVDGQALAPSAFGTRHPRTGQWRPKNKAALKAVVNAGSANSYFLDFSDPTNTTTLCTDQSSKGNNFTATNISLTAGTTYDSLVDSPTNNFPVLNAVFAMNGFAPGTISDGALKFASTATYHFTPCTVALPSTGKWYCEFIPQDVAGFIGLVDLVNGSGASQNIGNGFGWYGTAIFTGNGAVAQSGLAAWAANDVIGVLADMDAMQMKLYKNNALIATQALTANVRYAFGCGDYHSTLAATITANFGQQPFVYTPPSGSKALSTKNLTKPVAAVQKSTLGFVACTDTGANIVAALAAAAPWTNWIRIYKRRDSAEGWRWQFSDDSANYMDSSSTAAKAAFPALGGTSYVGYAMQVDPRYGIATGRLTHVNGVADVIADGLGKSRKVVILKNESTGNWLFYHPDLTSGNLLYMNLQQVETADTTISAVNSSGFTVAAALASGTYRWVVIAETPDFTKVGSYVDNASADGPLGYCESSAMAFFKYKSAGSCDWMTYDIARNPSNVMSASLRMNSTAAEGTRSDLDATSSFLKVRSAVATSDSINFTGAGGTHVFVSFTAFPLRYANAR